jgi:hypothetical protein
MNNESVTEKNSQGIVTVGGQSEVCFDYPEFYSYVAKKDFSTYVEVGSYYGWSTAYLAKELMKHNPNAIFYAIDLFDLPLPEESKGSGGTEIPFMRERQYRIFLKTLKSNEVTDFVTVIKGCSWDMAANFDDNSLDFVYIDADHSYIAVKKDIAAWAPKMKKGGILAGHDYGSHESVRQAVQELLGDRANVWDEGYNKVWYVNI